MREYKSIIHKHTDLAHKCLKYKCLAPDPKMSTQGDYLSYAMLLLLPNLQSCVNLYLEGHCRSCLLAMAMLLNATQDPPDGCSG